MKSEPTADVFSALTRRALVKPRHLLDMITINKLSFTIPNKMCNKKNNQIFKNAHFLNKRHICCLEHGLQKVYAHNFNKVWSCSCWHNRCTLHERSANWRSIEVQVLLEWQGTTEEERLVSSTRQGWDSKSGPCFWKHLGTKSWVEDCVFSTKVIQLHVWHAVWTQLLTINLHLGRKNKKISRLTSKNPTMCVSIDLHLTKDNVGVKMLIVVRGIYRWWEHLISAISAVFKPRKILATWTPSF